jgi:hypothetical protein
MNGEQYQVKSWQDIWNDSDYWSKVHTYGHFRGKNWVGVRNGCPVQRPYVEKFWKGRYYVNYRIMQDKVFDPYDRRWLTQPETEWPAQEGYVYPATYGRTFWKNISDVWEIETP